MEQNQQPVPRGAIRLARLIGIGVLLLALLVLAGWVLDLPLLKSALPGQVSMKANAAVGFVLAALALWLLGCRAAPPWRQRVALGCALVVAALGAVSLTEYLLGVNLGIDQLLFRESVGAVGTPGRMAPLTALSFVLLGTAFWLVTRPRTVPAAQGLAVLVAVIGLLNLVGYVYDAEGFYKLGSYTPMAGHTAAAFLALGLGVLCARPDAGLVRTVMSHAAGGVIARRLLPVAVVVPLVLGWLRLQGQHAGLYDTAFGVALTTVASILVLVAVIWSTAGLLDRGDRERQWAEEALRQANERLEQRVHERTVELEAANIGLNRGMAERRQAEGVLRQSEEKYRSLFESSRDAVMTLEPPSWKFTSGNPAAVKMFGAKNEEDFISHAPWELSPDWQPDGRASAEKAREMIETAVRQGSHFFEWTYRRIGAEEFPADVLLTRMGPGGKTMLQATVRDITVRKRAENTLRDSQELYSSLVENLPQSVFRKDGEGRFRFCNEQFCKGVGHSLGEILGKTDADFFPPHLAKAYRQDDLRVMESGQALDQVEEHVGADGRKLFVQVVKTPLRDASGGILGIQGIFWDVTEQRKLEAQLLRAQRLESIGTLAGGVAHDLNNALAPILMASELLRLEFPDTATSYLELIQAGAKRGADMVKQLLTFSKGAEGERLLVQPRHLLKEMRKLIESTFPKNLELRTSYGKDLRTVLGDATQLQQVLLNLCVNARDAMPSGGTLTVQAENVEIDATYAREVPEAKPGHYVVWRVSDTGTGIPPEILDRIFEPFFTTKGPDKGTGLGLSTVIGIVRSHGGFVRVYSAPGQGSTFAVYFPAYGADAGDTSLLVKVETTFRGNGETVLVVDDEAAVREVMRKVLTALNFKVLTVANGTEALIQVAEKRAELRMVITDLHMPQMDGLTFVRVLKGRLPGAGIIVISGRLDEREANEFKALGVSALLDKPFTQARLVEALKTVLQK